MRFLCEATVCAKNLRVDPSPIGAGKEGDDACDIVWLAEAFEWGHAADLLNLFFCLAIQEKFRPHRPRCNGVDRNLVSAKLVSEDVDEAFNARLGGDIGTIGGEALGEHAAGEGDDAAPFGYMLSCLREDEEGSA
jgi:hypothetical protein